MRTFGKDDMSLGVDVVEIPFIWIPDGHTGPRPGYPWFEAGRLTLGVEHSAAGASSGDQAQRGDAAAGSYGTSADPGTHATASAALPGTGAGEMSADGAEAGFGPDAADPFANSPEHARSYGDPSAVAVRAAIEALDALSNPGSGATMLDAASRQGAAARSVSADRFGSADQVHNRTLTGMATYYDLPGSKTASGQVFDRNGLNAAMTSEKSAIGTKVRVQLQSDPSRSIDVIVNDAGPFARDANGRPMHPLRADPNSSSI